MASTVCVVLSVQGVRGGGGGAQSHEGERTSESRTGGERTESCHQGTARGGEEW